MVVFVPTAGHGCVRTSSVWCVAQYLVMFTFIFIHLQDAFCQTIVVEISATKSVKYLLNTYLSNEQTSYANKQIIKHIIFETVFFRHTNYAKVHIVSADDKQGPEMHIVNGTTVFIACVTTQCNNVYVHNHIG